jgi:CMP-N,N'-diacetyllegionaminic acid synthase
VKILALITARGGSKRVPGKNIRPLGGMPLVVWSIDIVKGVSEVCDTLVTTDDAGIAEVSRAAGALAPWLRPVELASDTATSADVCIHALDWYEQEKGKVDGMLLLQPTSPFRSRETVFRGIDLFRTSQFRPVVGISPADSHPLWCFKLTDGGMEPFVEGDGLQRRSQDLPLAYVVNGAFYLISPEQFRRSRSFYSADMIPLLMDRPEEGIDIDTEWDWKIAECVASLAL